jgi:hypothetical protein
VEEARNEARGRARVKVKARGKVNEVQLVENDVLPNTHNRSDHQRRVVRGGIPMA